MDKTEQVSPPVNPKIPFSRWAQCNLDYTHSIMWLQLNHPKAAALLTYLVDQMDNFNAVMCSYCVLKEALGVGTATITRSVRTLKEHGYIAVFKSGSANIYTVNDSLFWKNYNHKLHHSKFPANVVLSVAEQEKSFQTRYKIHKEIVLEPILQPESEGPEKTETASSEAPTLPLPGFEKSVAV